MARRGNSASLRFGLGLLAIILSPGCQREPRVADLPPKPEMPLATPPVIDVGIIPTDGSLVYTVECINSTDAELRPETVTTGCACLTASWYPKSIPPRESAYLRLAFDMTKTGYTGPLLLEVRGLDAAGQEVLRFDVRGKIVPGQELGLPVAKQP